MTPRIFTLKQGDRIFLGEKIAGLTDPCPRHVGPFASCFDLGLGHVCQSVLQTRDKPRTFSQPHDVGRQTRVGGELLKGKLFNESRPLLIGGDANE